MSYVIGVVGLIALLTAWIAVQRLWKQVFAGDGEDPDALAGRLGCHGCAKPGDCDGSQCETPGEGKEEWT